MLILPSHSIMWKHVLGGYSPENFGIRLSGKIHAACSLEKFVKNDSK